MGWALANLARGQKDTRNVLRMSINNAKSMLVNESNGLVISTIALIVMHTVSFQ